MSEEQDKEFQQPLKHAEGPDDSPGSLLKKTREQLGYKTEEVASFLHLSRNIIEAIEADDYSKLPAVTFTKGYLRAYAKFLKLDADDIIKRLSANYIEEQERAPVQRVIVKEVKASDKPVKWLSYIIVLALGALVILWWHNHSNNNNALAKKIDTKPTDLQENTNPQENTNLQESNQLAKSDNDNNAKAQPTVNKTKTNTAGTSKKPESKNKPLPTNKSNNKKITHKKANNTTTSVAHHTDKHDEHKNNSLSNTDDITIQSASAKKKHQAHKVHEGKKQFSGWDNPDTQ